MNRYFPQAETPRKAARRLAVSALSKGFEAAGLHKYTNPDGEPIFWKIRLKHRDGRKWIRPMHHDGHHYELGEPDFGDAKKPIYRLQEICAHPDAPVIVTEGETCADALAELGLIATTSGSATSADAADWLPLAGRCVTLWPDNDQAGHAYAEAVGRILLGLGCKVATIDAGALGLSDCGDAVDWLAAHPGATAAHVASLPVIADDGPRTDSQDVRAPAGTPAPAPAPIDHAAESLDGVVARLGALLPLEYDQVREAEAERLGVRVTVLDSEVSKARAANSQEGARPMLFNDPAPWSEPVNGADLLREIHATIGRFIVCDEPVKVAAALWAAFTWFIDSVQVAPLAIITAPEKRCGKSQLLNLLHRLSRRSLAASSITPAALFRVIEAYGPSLMIDEADAFMRDNEELRGIINSGHTRQSAYVIRTVGDDHEPQQFSTWGAKAIAGIGKLPETVMDRAIVMELRRKLPNENAQRLRHAPEHLFRNLAAKLARFAADHAGAVARARPTLPDALNDRAQDNWEPLFAIAECAGGDWPKRAREAALKLSGTERDDTSPAGELLRDIQDAFHERRASKLFTADLLNALNADELKPWATYNRGREMTAAQLARKLREYKIEPRTIRIGTDTRKGFMLEWFADTFARYLPGTSADSRHTSQSDGSPCVSKVCDVSPTVTANSPSVTRHSAVTAQAPDSFEESAVCDSVTANRSPAAEGVEVIAGAGDDDQDEGAEL